MITIKDTTVRINTCLKINMQKTTVYYFQNRKWT